VQRFADALGARIALLDGDSAGAIRGLRAGLGVGRRELLEWDVGESLAPERLLLARLLLASGQPEEAIAVAAAFDHPAPAAFLPFLPVSLTLRRQAALQAGRREEAKRYQVRLEALGQAEDQARESSLSPHAEAP
jgi:hypothetical protein